MDIDSGISTVLATLRLETDLADLVNVLYQLEDFYERKLWHQLTLALDDFYALPETPGSGLRTKIYDLFVAQFQQKVNSIKVVDFLLLAYARSSTETVDKLVVLREAFIRQLKAERSTYKEVEALEDAIQNDEAVIYANLHLARHYLLANRVAEAETLLDAISVKFDLSLNFENDFSAKINAAYYLTKCQYFKLQENYNSFYTHGLLYLSLVDTALLSHDEQLSLCHDLSLAALLGDKIYNFGELVLHDILLVIRDSADYNWLYSLIHHLNAGNLQEFNRCLQMGLQKSPFLVKFQSFLQQKIIIMALLELISRKSTTNKRLSFREISDFTGTPADNVELLIIKCFSLSLIRGYINQLDEVLVVTWLQPRILNLDQVKVLYNHLSEWDAKVEKLGREVHENGGLIWAGV